MIEYELASKVCPNFLQLIAAAAVVDIEVIALRIAKIIENHLCVESEKCKDVLVEDDTPFFGCVSAEGCVSRCGPTRAGRPSDCILNKQLSVPYEMYYQIIEAGGK